MAAKRREENLSRLSQTWTKSKRANATHNKGGREESAAGQVRPPDSRRLSSIREQRVWGESGLAAPRTARLQGLGAWERGRGKILQYFLS